MSLFFAAETCAVNADKCNMTWLNALADNVRGWRCVEFLFGYRLDKYHDDETGYSTFTWLFGLILSQSLALGIFEQGKGVRWYSIVGYVLFSFITLGGMVIILRAPRIVDSKTIHAFDRGTIMFGRWTLFWSICIAVTFAGLGTAGLIPGQTPPVPVYLPIEDINEYDWKLDDSKGLIVSVGLSSDEIPSSDLLPQSLTMYALLEAPLAKDWEILRIDGFTRRQDGPNLPMSPGPFLYDESRNPKVAELRFLVPTTSYSFDIYLHKTKKVGMAITAAKKLIKDELALKVSVKQPE